MYEQIINLIDIGMHIQGLKVNDLPLHRIGKKNVQVGSALGTQIRGTYIQPLTQITPSEWMDEIV